MFALGLVNFQHSAMTRGETRSDNQDAVLPKQHRVRIQKFYGLEKAEISVTAALFSAGAALFD